MVGFVVGRNNLADLALAIATALLVASAVLNARSSGYPLVERRHSERRASPGSSRPYRGPCRRTRSSRPSLNARGTATLGADHGRARAAATRRNPPKSELRLDAAWRADRDVGHADPAVGSRRGARKLPTTPWPQELGLPDGLGGEEDARDLANQIASRLRDAHGLRNTLAAPLLEVAI